MTVNTDECWLYAGNITDVGYGRLQLPTGRYLVHRLTYEQFVDKIPEGFDIDHLCRIRSCVNPEHLEAVTRKENILRGEGLAAVNARKTHCSKGHPYTGHNLYYVVQSNDGLRRRKCRICYNEHSRSYYYKNKEKWLEYNRRRRAKAKNI